VSHGPSLDAGGSQAGLFRAQCHRSLLASILIPPSQCTCDCTARARLRATSGWHNKRGGPPGPPLLRCRQRDSTCSGYSGCSCPACPCCSACRLCRTGCLGRQPDRFCGRSSRYWHCRFRSRLHSGRHLRSDRNDPRSTRRPCCNSSRCRGIHTSRCPDSGDAGGHHRSPDRSGSFSSYAHYRSRNSTDSSCYMNLPKGHSPRSGLRLEQARGLPEPVRPAPRRQPPSPSEPRVGPEEPRACASNYRTDSRPWSVLTVLIVTTCRTIGCTGRCRLTRTLSAKLTTLRPIAPFHIDPKPLAASHYEPRSVKQPCTIGVTF
jgi:hypothetical protein